MRAKPLGLEMNRHRAALGFVFVTVLLDMLAFGIIAPVLPRLILDFLHGNMASTSEAMGLFVTTWALMQFFFSPILGMLSDRFGRRPIILLSNFGLALDYIIMALAPTLSWLFLGRVLSGITASSMPTANAYISDVTPPERRAKAFGIFGAAFGFGFVLGPAIGGWLGAINPRLPFWVAGAFSLLNACYGLLVLPESLSAEKRSQTLRWKNANPVGALKLLRSHRELFGLAAVNFLGYLAHEVYATVFVLYATERYGWNRKSVGRIPCRRWSRDDHHFRTAGRLERAPLRRTHLVVYGTLQRGHRFSHVRIRRHGLDVSRRNPRECNVVAGLRAIPIHHDSARFPVRTRGTSRRSQFTAGPCHNLRAIHVLCDLCLLPRPRTLLPRRTLGARRAFAPRESGYRGGRRARNICASARHSTNYSYSGVTRQSVGPHSPTP